MMLPPHLRRAMRLLDGAPEALRRAVAPRTRHDLLRGPFSAESRFHAIPVVILCLEGPLHLRTRSERFDLGPGEAIVVPGATWYARRHHPRLATVGFGWLGRRADLWLEAPGCELWAELPLRPARDQIRAADEARADAARSSLVRDLLTTVAASELDGLRTVPEPVSDMLSEILMRLHLTRSTADLVAASGLGRSQAYARFTDFYGMSPGRALELRRLELAGCLLAAGHGVSATALACGWRDRETFSRAWSRHHGRPPSVGA